MAELQDLAVKLMSQIALANVIRLDGDVNNLAIIYPRVNEKDWDRYVELTKSGVKDAV